jgi:hypothetical protein
MNDITIVSALFSFKKNKYNSHDIYKFWGSNLFPNLNTNVVIFTDEENYDFICSLRVNELKEKTRIIKMKIEDFYMYKYIDYLKKDLERDHENNIHNIDLYMIWNEKLNFIKKAIDFNFFNSSYYAWCDFGSVRNSLYPDLYIKTFPNLSNLTEEKIYMFKVDCEFSEEDYKNPYDEKYKYWNGTIAGSFFIGKKELLLKFYDYFYNEIIINYINRDIFIGKDHNLYISLYLSHPELFKLINGENDNYSINFSQLKWFYFLKYLS